MERQSLCICLQPTSGQPFLGSQQCQCDTGDFGRLKACCPELGMVLKCLHVSVWYTDAFNECKGHWATPAPAIARRDVHEIADQGKRVYCL